MRTPRLPRLVTTTLTLVAAGCAADSGGTRQVAHPTLELEGLWQSEACVASPQADGSTLFLSRAFEFTGGRWQLSLRTHADEACGVPLLQIDVAGEYRIEGPSRTIDGAFDARFGRSTVAVVPRAHELVPVLEGAGCGQSPWRLDEAQSVAAGCLFLPAIEACPEEYDVVRRDGERVFFGLRQGSLCTADGRPTALDQHAMVRVGD